MQEQEQSESTDTGTHKMIKVEHDVLTGEIIEREMTAEEIAAYENDMQTIENQRIADEEAKATKAAERAALLAKLGITEAEAELLS